VRPAHFALFGFRFTFTFRQSKARTIPFSQIVLGGPLWTL
jgi:hypothetical protein